MTVNPDCVSALKGKKLDQMVICDGNPSVTNRYTRIAMTNIAIVVPISSDAKAHAVPINAIVLL